MNVLSIAITTIVLGVVFTIGVTVLGRSYRARLADSLAREQALLERVQALETAAAEAANPPWPHEPGDEPGTLAAGVHAELGPELCDEQSGLLNERFFVAALETRVSAARRYLRPVAVVLLRVGEGIRGGRSQPAPARVVARGIQATLREADTACRLDDGRFALILEDTAENGAVWTVERVRRRLLSERSDQTMWAGVACYPAHAFDAHELLLRCEHALAAALEWRQDRIEVAAVD